MSERELAKLYESEIDELREQLAAAEARAFAVEEKGCPRCMSYRDLEKKLQAAERVAERLEAACRAVLARLNNPMLDTSLFDDNKAQLIAALAAKEGT